MLKKAFTLIELLVVIGIMAVLAAGVVALIDPLEKTRQANDANVQNAIGQVATAMQSYAAQTTTGTYPALIGDLTTSGELVALPVGVAVTMLGGGTNHAAVYAQLTSKKYIAKGANPYWYWDSAIGQACGHAGIPALGNACTFH